MFCHSGADCADCCYCCCLPSFTPLLHQRYDYCLSHLLKISALLDKHMDTDTSRQHGLQTKVGYIIFNVPFARLPSSSLCPSLCSCGFYYFLSQLHRKFPAATLLPFMFWHTLNGRPHLFQSRVKCYFTF